MHKNRDDNNKMQHPQRRRWLSGAMAVLATPMGLWAGRALSQQVPPPLQVAVPDKANPDAANANAASANKSTSAAEKPSLRNPLRTEKSKITIAVSNRAALSYLPLTVAEQLGFFRAEGIEADIIEVAGVARALQATTSGAADIASAWFENILSPLDKSPQDKAAGWQAFVLQTRAPQMVLGLSTKNLPLSSGLQDLRGKKIGIVAPGTPSATVACGVLARAGIAAAEVGWVSVGTPAGALAALRAGQIDALCYNDPLATQLELRGELRVVADTRTLRGTSAVFGGELPSTCLIAPAEFLAKNPNTAQAATHAIVRALKWLQTAGVSDIMKTVPDAYLAGERALYLASFNKMRESFAIDGIIAADSARTLLAAMRSAEPSLRSDRLDLAKSYTNAFARKAKARFRV